MIGSKEVKPEKMKTLGAQNGTRASYIWVALRRRGFIEEDNIWNLSGFGAIFLTFHGCFYNRVNTNRGGIPHFPGLPRMFL